MKILYYFAEEETLMHKWQRSHFIDELSHYGVIIDVFNPLEYDSIVSANEEMIKQLDRGYSLFMTPHNERFLSTSSLNKIKAMNVPSLLICFDNLVVPFVHKKICKYFDLVWLTSIETEHLFRKWGAKTIFLPYAANPFILKPFIGNISNRICFAGSPYGSRQNTIAKIIDSDINIDLYFNNTFVNVHTTNNSVLRYFRPFGNLIRFKHGRRIIYGAIKQKIIKPEELNLEKENVDRFNSVPIGKLGELYSSYSLSLSSTAARNTGVLKKPLDIVNLRSFEIPMCGGIQICPYNSELASYFEEGKEIVFYYSESDMIDKINFYLSPENTQICNRIRIAAREKAVREHSWAARFHAIFEVLNLKFNLEVTDAQ